MLILISSFKSIKAEEKYLVYDASNDNNIQYFETLKDAQAFYEDNKDAYDNLALSIDDKIVLMEYGVVEFNSESCKLNNDYYSNTNGSSYLNSCYSSEALYLNTTDDYKYVSFLVSDDIGEISIEEVNLVPYEQAKNKISVYQTKNGYLHHTIRTSLDSDYYAYDNKLDNKPEYLDDNKTYYSYDGHYFYDDFRLMSDDYRSDNNQNAINPENAYYNYYMYLPHRSYTNYSFAELDDYFNNTLCFNGKIQYYDDLNLDNANDDVNLSQLYNELDAFFGYEKIYGANALMMLSLAIHESAYGKSYLAFTKNNLFGHAAYDSDAERYASRYANISSSIYSHAKYFISRLYSGIYSKVYFGSFFGDKLSGMNVLYSSDPHWSEKIASIYFDLDSKLGFKDKDAYALGIIKNKDTIRVYEDKDLSSLLFSISDIKNYSIIILDEVDDVYKIQIDSSKSSDYKYDQENSIGYIDKDIVDYVVNEDKIHNRDYVEYYFDFDGGLVDEENEITIKTIEGLLPIVPKPYKEGYEFIGFDKELSKDVYSYKALYKEIKDISVVSEFSHEIEKDTAYNLKGGLLLVNYVDGTNKEINIDSNMIESFDKEDTGIDHIEINYCGVKLDYPYSISEELKQTHEKVEELISKNIDSYKENGTYNIEEIKYIKDNIKRLDYRTSFDDVRYIDKMLLENTRESVNYTFKESIYDVSISGLALALGDPKPLTIFKPFKDTYYIEVKELSDEANDRLLKVAKPYGFEKEFGIKVNVKLNMEVAYFTNPIIIEVKLPETSNNKIYTVYHLDEDGNVIKCFTEWSNNYVRFMTRSEGDFLIMSKEGINKYDLEDHYENVSIENADPDNHLIFIEGSIFITIAILGFIMIIIHNILTKKEEKIWNDYKKSLQEAESLPEEKPKN